MFSTICGWIGAHLAGLAVDALAILGARCLHCGARRNVRDHVEIDRWSLRLCHHGIPEVVIIDRAILLCGECATAWVTGVRDLIADNDQTIRTGGTFRPPGGFVVLRLAIVQIVRDEIPHLRVLADVSMPPSRERDFAELVSRSMDGAIE